MVAINHVRNSDSSVEACQKHVVRVVLVPRHFSIIDTLHDPKSKFKYVSMVGGVVVNSQMERKSYNMGYVDTSYSLFSFFMALFCQSIRNEFKFNLAPLECVEYVDSVGRVGYDSKFDICGNGHIRCMLSYNADIDSKPIISYEGSKITDVYKSPIVDISVDLDKESFGYFPGVKGFYSKHVKYNKYLDGFKYEDCGVKHLYEKHHGCNEGKYCEQFCCSTLTQCSHKQNDMFQLENEEMICTDCTMDYDQLSEMYFERSHIDENQKAHAYSTLIPLPCLWGVREMCVYITKINVDLSCDFVSPHTIQDHVYMNYDKDSLQVRLTEPLLSQDSVYVDQKWHRQALLTSLNDIMKDYGRVE